jgi:hypothetical protein
MTIAQQIKEQVTEHYGSCPDREELVTDLRRNRLHNSLSTLAPHHGYDLPYDSALPIIFYYADESILIVTQSRVFTALELAD